MSWDDTWACALTAVRSSNANVATTRRYSLKGFCEEATTCEDEACDAALAGVDAGDRDDGAQDLEGQADDQQLRRTHCRSAAMLALAMPVP